jgi:MarR-like DNA-binding transcriptional regulator SgrR of sgrS sRNA
MAEECLKLGGTFDLENLFRETELNRTEQRLCKALADCAFSDTEASVETKTLALLCGVTPRHTRKVLRSLEKKGLIQREEQFIGLEGRTQTSNKFTLLFNRPGHDHER